MSILNREAFFNAVNTMVGTDTSENALSFIEDMTDTYNELERKALEDGVNWEQKYHELDDSWKKKYKSRFFSGNGNSAIPYAVEEPDVKDPNKTRIEDLFTPAKKR